LGTLLHQLMGNQFISCGRDGFLDSHSLLCRRVCGLEELEQDMLGCDPAGVIFDDTLRQLCELDRVAFRFAGSSNLAGLRWAFVFGAKLEARDANGSTLLHAACRTGSFQVVRDLVRRTLPLDATDNAGWTALHVSSCMGRRDVSLLLLQCGAQAQPKNTRGQTPEDLCSHLWTKEVVITYGTEDRSKSSSVGFPTRTEYAPGVGSGCCPQEIGAGLHFEPFFVPRDPVLHEPRHREGLQRLGLDLFNRSPGHGLAFLVAVGVVRDYPVEINNFLVRVGASPTCIGEFLGEEFPIAQTLRLEFLNSLPLLGTGVVSALETAFHEMAVPSDWLKADRLTRGIAHFWWRQHEEEHASCDDVATLDPEVTPMPGSRTGHKGRGRDKNMGNEGELQGWELQRHLLGTDGLHRLMYSSLMLHRWLKAGNQMSMNEWTQLNADIEINGNDVPLHIQTGVYKALTQGTANLANKKAAPTWPVAPPPTIEGKASIQCSGRAQVANGSDPAAWPEASPRILAAQGGVSSAGRASLQSSVATISNQGKTAMRQISRPFDAGQNSGCDEPAWLSLHQWILLLSSATAEAPPYAFVSLRRTILKEVDSENRRLVLASRSDSGWPPAAASEDEWLELCLLLDDGRFQQLEAPQLELKLGKAADFNSWVARLRQVCCDGHTLRGPRANNGPSTIAPPDNGGADLQMPPLSVSGPDEPAVLQVPPLPGEDKIRAAGK